MRQLLILSLMALSWTLSAQTVPPLINYQGRLANADGTPFPTADYELRVSIYDAASGGNLVWGPQVFDGAPEIGHGARLPVVQGFFNVLLGPVDTQGRSILDAFGDSNRFVQVTVSNRPPILPRQSVISAPYALRAMHAQSADVLKTPIGSNQVLVGSLPLDRLQPRQEGVGAVGNIHFSPRLSRRVFQAGNKSIDELKVEFECSGRPVLVGLQWSGSSGYEAELGIYDNSPAPNASVVMVLSRNSTIVGIRNFSISVANGVGFIGLSPEFLSVDFPPSGPVTYTVSLNVAGVGDAASLQGVRVVAFEL